MGNSVFMESCISLNFFLSSLDVASEHLLYVLLLEAALEDELVVAVDGRPGSAQLGRQEGEQMLGLTMQPEMIENQND